MLDATPADDFGKIIICKMTEHIHYQRIDGKNMLTMLLKRG